MKRAAALTAHQDDDRHVDQRHFPQVQGDGLGDAGAHCGMICDGSFPSFLLQHFGRDRTRGERLPLEWLIGRQTADTAALMGLSDRGRIAPGLRADLNLIDYDHLTFDRPYVTFDLPAGGRRLLQHADGYEATMVSGVVTYEDAEADALSEQLAACF